MKYIDVSEIFSRRRANVVVMSTYDFDPLYFEHRLLRSTTFLQARRILIFMDAGRYEELCRTSLHTRYLNDRYLVVPVRPKRGVFHPKLHLMMRKNGATVLCGSNNITQAGFTSNLEMLNAIDIDAGEEGGSMRGCVRDVLDFFEQLGDLCEGPARDMAMCWIRDITIDFPWVPTESDENKNIRLIHTLNGQLLDQITPFLRNEPSCVMVVSPFYDKDLRLLEKLKKLWPNCLFELVAQERTSTLPVDEVAKSGGNVSLYRVNAPNHRRLHAKLLVLLSGDDAWCLSGSANFTSAAFEARNVEAGLFFKKSAEEVNALFDHDLEKERIDPEQFEPGDTDEPSMTDDSMSSIGLKGARLDKDGRLHLAYTLKEDQFISSLRLKLQGQGQSLPFHSLKLPDDPGSYKPLSLPENALKQVRGAVQCILCAEMEGNQEEETSSTWLIQEHRLTHEHSESKGAGSERERVIKECGRGTMEYLEIIAEREGMQAVVDFLNKLNIRYDADRLYSRNSDIGALAVHDPTLPDDIPDWVHSPGGDLSAAILDFVDRHHKSVLAKHAGGGNINGLTNFMDVFVECNKLLYVYSVRGVIKPLFAMDRMLRSIGLASSGYDWLDVEFPGYIKNIKIALEGEDELLRETLNEACVAEHILLAMHMAQILRWSGSKIGSPCDFLPKPAAKVAETFSSVGIMTSAESMDRALGVYPVAIAEDPMIAQYIRTTNKVVA